MKSYRTLALKELLSQKVTSILILIAVVLSTMMTTIVGQSIGVLSAMREQQAIAIGGNRYATFLQMNADQLHALEQDERLSYVGKSIYMGSLELSPSLTLGLMEYLDAGLPHQGGIEIVGLVDAYLRPDEFVLDQMAQEHFQRLPVLLVHGEQEKGQHHQDHAQRRRGGPQARLC